MIEYLLLWKFTDHLEAENKLTFKNVMWTTWKTENRVQPENLFSLTHIYYLSLSHLEVKSYNRIILFLKNIKLVYEFYVTQYNVPCKR